MKFEYLKKITAVMLITSIIYPSASLLFADKTFAQSPLNLPGGSTSGGIQLPKLSSGEEPVPSKAASQFMKPDKVKEILNRVPTNDAQARLSFWDTLGKFSAKLIGQVLKKALLDRMVDAVIAWINRDGQGSIIENWDKFIEQAGDDAIDGLVKSLGAGFLCGPINFQVNLALVDREPFYQQGACTLDVITGNIDDFIENMENGGFIGYQAQMQPRNNYYGTVLMAWDEANTIKAKAERAAQSEAIAGQGFLSQQLCDLPDGKCRTVTPGSYVGDFAKKAYIDAPFQSILSADDISVYISAIANAAINRLAKHGIEGLKGTFKKKTSEYTTTTAAAPCAGLTGDAFRACSAREVSGQRNYEFSRDTILAEVYGTYTPMFQATALLSEAVALQSEYVSALEQLAAPTCKPNETNLATLQNESDILDDLQFKYEDSQTFLEPLEEKIADMSAESGEEGYGSLMSNAMSIDSLLDPQNASNFFEITQLETQEIKDLISAQLPVVQSQLIGCSGQ